MDSSRRPLRAWPCQTMCSWSLTEGTVDGVPVVECAGCGTEWTRHQEWTTVDSSGIVPPAVLAEVALRQSVSRPRTSNG